MITVYGSLTPNREGRITVRVEGERPQVNDRVLVIDSRGGSVEGILRPLPEKKARPFRSPVVAEVQPDWETRR